jgi:hypothetical protein
LAVTASVVAFQQPPRPDPLSAPSLFSWAWWRHPIETNAIRRLTFISSNIQDIALVPNTNTLWIVGSGGLLASSEDGGLTWEKHEIRAILPPSTGVTNNYEPLLQKDSTVTPTPTPARSLREREKKAGLEGKNDFRRIVFTAAEAEKKSPPNVGPRQSVISPTPRPRVEETPYPTPAERDSPAPIQQTDTPTTFNSTTPTATPTPSPATTLSPPASGMTNNTPLASAPDLTAISFYDKEHGAAVGRDGAIVLTTDGGETWNQQSALSNLDMDFLAVCFESPEVPIAVASNGAFARRGDHGIWNISVWAGASVSFGSAFVPNPTDAWGWGSGSALYRATNRAGWKATKAVLPVFIPVGTNGHIAWIGPAEEPVKMRMLDRRPVDAPALPDPRTNSILFPGNDHDAWAVGDEGIIFATSDAGKSWRPLALAPSPELKKQWQDAGTHRRFPAPWYYIVCALALGLCVPMLRRPPDVTQQSSVADMLASDRPIEPGEPDPLQFNAVALGLSRFLRNANTTPPLSIAITGEWGTGKSSLMNLLRGDLRARGFRPVWFNPWHHQKEEHLLAALLENIQAQAIPALFSFQGLCYRLPLLWFRARRFWRMSLFLAILLAISAGYFAVEPGQRMERAAKELRALTTTIAKSISDLGKKPIGRVGKKKSEPGENKMDTAETSNVPTEKEKDDSQSQKGRGASAAIALITTLIASIVGVVSALRSFGVDPTSLLATSAVRPRLRDLKAETSFRYKFARQFADVTRSLRAWNYRTMVILVDDLDRCRPESVVEMLEAVNFLVTCGECFIVIGMARERVERCVGLAFKDMAEEVFGRAGDKESNDEERKKRRAEFAKQYLEKLINIEVPVPEATPEQSRDLLGRDEALAGPRRSGWRSPRVRAIARTAGVTSTVLFLLLAAFVGGKMIFPKLAPGRNAAATQPPTEQPSTARPPSSSAENPQPAPAGPRATLDSATPGEAVSWIFWPLLAALVAAGVWSTLMLPANVVYDSVKFIEALRRWQPIISMRRNTPRSLKRFLNRVRYLAMRQRAVEPERSKWDALWAKLRGRSSPEGEVHSDGVIDEEILVGLCACKYLFPDESVANAIDLAKQELTPYPHNIVPADSELRDYLAGEFGRQAGESCCLFEKLHAGLHVY